MFDSKNVKENYNLTSAKIQCVSKKHFVTHIKHLFISMHSVLLIYTTGIFFLPQSIYTIYFISLDIVKNRNIQISC